MWNAFPFHDVIISLRVLRLTYLMRATNSDRRTELCWAWTMSITPWDNTRATSGTNDDIHKYLNQREEENPGVADIFHSHEVRYLTYIVFIYRGILYCIYQQLLLLYFTFPLINVHSVETNIYSIKWEKLSTPCVTRNKWWEFYRDSSVQVNKVLLEVEKFMVIPYLICNVPYGPPCINFHVQIKWHLRVIRCVWSTRQVGFHVRHVANNTK